MSYIYRITASHSEKVPTVQYGSEDTFSSMTCEITSEKALTDKQLVKHQEKLEGLVREAVKREADKIRGGSSLVSLPSDHRFTDINGKPCPHVTNIISPVKPTYIKHLEEHGLQGTWLDGCFKNFIIEGVFAPISEPPHTPNIGSVKVLFETAEKWIEKYVKTGILDFLDHSLKVFNEEHWFCGELDAMGTYKEDKELEIAIMDFKKTKTLSKALVEKYFIQMAAYCLSDNLPVKPKVMVICSPYNPPLVSRDIEGYQKKFLDLRKEYKTKFKV